MKCPECNHIMEESASSWLCPDCGHHLPLSIVSEGGDSLDHLIQAASVPNLASLFRRAKDAGLIKAGKEYGEGK